jgi:hypothetical protein
MPAAASASPAETQNRLTPIILDPAKQASTTIEAPGGRATYGNP